MKRWILILILAVFFFTGCAKQAEGLMGGWELPEEAGIAALSEDVDGLEVHFLDVGQADCILIRSGSHFMLVDAGNRDDEEFILSYLRKQGVVKLDYAIATHPHEDHIGSMAAVIRNFSVGKVIMSQRTHSTKTFENMVMAIEEKKLNITPAKAGDRYAFGEAVFTVLSPVNEKEEDSLNNVSVGIRLAYGKNSFVMCGDAEKEEEANICSNQAKLKADVLKVGHHGSHTSSSEEFIKAVAPDIAVISVGKDNDYGHPDEDVVKRLKDIGAEVYRTDDLGTVILTSNGKDISILQGDREADIFKNENSLSGGNERIGGKSGEGEQLSERETKMESLKEYVLNASTNKFHKPDCSSVNGMKEKNKRLYHGSRDDIIEQGYTPCKTCNP